jgi:acetyl esterase
MSAPQLHPDAAGFLEELDRLGLPSASGSDAGTLRARFRRICAHFAGAPAEMEEVEDLAAPVRARRYLPPEARAGEALVWLHGGRMITGDLETHDAACRLLARACGCPVLAVDYRLGPEHPFPAALEDARAALEWAASAYERVAVGGDSAGAALALDAALHARGRTRALVLVYPMVDATMSEPSHREFLHGPGTSSEDIAAGYDLWLPPGTDRRDPLVSPLLAADFAGLPQAFVLTAEYDPLRDEGRRLAERLREDGVRVEFREVARHIHGFLTYPGQFAAAHETAESIAAFLTGCATAG